MSGSASPTTIANMALRHNGRKRIDSIDGTSIEAVVCKEFYDIAKDTVLEKVEFGFSERRVALALPTGVDTTGYDNWEYAYTYPNDCLIALRIFNSGSDLAVDEIPFILGTNATKDATYIFTNQQDAVLIYTAATESFISMKANAVQLAISYLLAVLIGNTLKVDRQKVQDNQTNYFVWQAEASAKDANERHEKPDKSDDYINAMQ